jgi:hypothetical protein
MQYFFGESAEIGKVVKSYINKPEPSKRIVPHGGYHGHDYFLTLIVTILTNVLNILPKICCLIQTCLL